MTNPEQTRHVFYTPSTLPPPGPENDKGTGYQNKRRLLGDQRKKVHCQHISFKT